MHPFRDAPYLRAHQYRGGATPDARRLHRAFTTATVAWHEWVFDRILDHTPEVAAVLEVDAGTGALWAHNYERLPMAWWVWLTELSPGPVTELRHAVDGAPQITVTEADAATLPLSDDTFDTVVANHLLHHVADPAAVLAELARVLRPGGTLLAAAHGGRHLAELYALLGNDPAAPARAAAHHFGLDTGSDLLADRYTGVRTVRFADELRVTDAHALVDHLRATLDGARLSRRRLAGIRSHVTRVIERDGAFRVTKDVGLFVGTAR